jgi:acylphosphatase
MSAAILRLRLSIQGRVQGVWYRESMRREAVRLGVSGWVRNCSDGSVEAIVEGEAPAVRELEAWCHAGPPAARVVAVRSHEEPPAGEAGFRVTH